jgi:hypothetical protein
LVAQAAPQTVTATGGTVTAGSMTLQFPAGAYAASTSVVATAYDGTAVPSVSGPVRYVDANGTGWEVLEALDVQVPSEPAQPVTLKAPVPLGTAASDVALVDLVGGAWANPVAPTSVSGGWATFSVAHFSDPAVVHKSSPSVWFTFVSGLVQFTDATGTHYASPGMECGVGCVIQTAQNALAEVVFDEGSVFQLFRDTQLAFLSEAAGFIIKLQIAWGTVKVHAKPLTTTPHVDLSDTHGNVAAVRGTVFDFTASSCGSGFEDFVDCTDGDVLLTAGGTSTDDPAGKEVTLEDPSCAATSGDAGTDAASDAGDASDCISGAWVGVAGQSPCGATMFTYVVAPSGSGYTIDGWGDNVTLDWWVDGGLHCGSRSFTASNVVWDGTKLTFDYVVPVDVLECTTITNSLTVTPDPTCQTSTGTSVSSGCGPCTSFGCNTCGTNTCPNGGGTGYKQ